MRLTDQVRSLEEENTLLRAALKKSRIDLAIAPVILSAEQDFEDAPLGTIVKGVQSTGVYEKVDDAWLGTGKRYFLLSREMPQCRVVQWGEHH